LYVEDLKRGTNTDIEPKDIFEMASNLKNFNDHQGLVIIRFKGVAEVIQRFKDFVQDFSGGLIRIIPDDLQQPLFAEHFSMGVNRFFDKPHLP
jgi:hypothetical protein